MARRRASGGRRTGGLPREDWLHLGRVAAAVVAVGGTLLAGALLQDDRAVAPAEVATSRAAADEAPRLDGGIDAEAQRDAGAHEPAPAAPPVEDSTPPPDEGPLTLAERMETDSRRLAGDDDAWTLQLMAACDRSNVERAVDSLGDDGRLLVLPATIGGRDCFRICWGPYGSRAAAEADRDRLPSSVLRLSRTPQPRPVAEVL